MSSSQSDSEYSDEEGYDIYECSFMDFYYERDWLRLKMNVVPGYNVPYKGEYEEITQEEYDERVNRSYVPKSMADLLYYDDLFSLVEIRVGVWEFLDYTGITGEQLVNTIIRDPELFMEILRVSDSPRSHDREDYKYYVLRDTSHFDDLAARATQIERVKSS